MTKKARTIKSRKTEAASSGRKADLVGKSAEANSPSFFDSQEATAMRPTSAQKTNVSGSAPPPRNILILDPGFRSLTGHHYNNNLSIVLAASQNNQLVKILSGETLEEAGELSGVVERFFKTDLYAGANFYQASWELDCWLAVNSQFARDLASIPADTLDWADLILVPAITQFHMLATARFLASTLSRRPMQKAAVNLMFSPTWTAWDAVCISGPQMYQEAISILDVFGKDRVAYFSELRASCREFEQLIDKRIDVLPHPGIWPDIIDPPSHSTSQTRPTRLGYFGYAKREKGFHLLPDIYQRVRQRFGPDEVEFVIHVNHGGYDGEIISADEALTAYPSTGLRILRGAISSEAYMSEFSDCDIILLPYDPELYRGRGSGVFSEAIGFGKVLIAPRSAGVGEEVEAGHGAGVLFDDHTPTNVADAVISALENFKVMGPSAVKLAPAWRAGHSGAAMLSIITNAFTTAD